MYQVTLNIYFGILGNEEKEDVREESLLYLLDEELVRNLRKVSSLHSSLSHCKRKILNKGFQESLLYLHWLICSGLTFIPSVGEQGWRMKLDLM